MHCGEMAYRILHDELGLEVESHELWIDKDAPDLDERVEAYLRGHGDRWERVGGTVESARELGDVVWSRGSEEFGRNHLSVVVRLDPVPMIASTGRRSGPFIQRASMVRRVRGVYRFVG